jgi:PAS domain S-box-containing protein
LRSRLEAAEQMLCAMRSGEVDALVVDGPQRPHVCTFKTTVEPYRMLIEQMAQAALTVSRHGLILYCNESFARLVGRRRDSLLGARLQEHVVDGDQAKLDELLQNGYEPGREFAMRTQDGDLVAAYLSSSSLAVEDDEVRCIAVTDLSQQELRLRHVAVVEASHDVIYALDENLLIQTWNRGAELLTGLAPAEAIGRSESELWPSSRVAELTELVRQVRESGRPVSIDTVRRREDGSRADLIYTLTPIMGRDGQLTGYSVVAHDITDRKQNEERLGFLTAELDHRAKNLLASVQAIVALSARNASGLEDFLGSFKARLQALAVAHTLLSDHNWGGALVRDIVDGALGGFKDDNRIRTEGESVELRPLPAQNMALSLHELATNALKYGSLSVPGGRVEIVWWLKDGKLMLEWSEHDGPPVTPPKRHGLGSRMIQQLITEKDAQVDYRFDPHGVYCRFELPSDMLSSWTPNQEPRTGMA